MNLKEYGKEVLKDLRELAELTTDEKGAQRVAWTKTWVQARQWWIEKAEALGGEVERDLAGNLWVKLEGESSSAIAVGSHMDSVPNGGDYDGALGLLTGLEILRYYRKQKPKKTLYLVDFADEEAARYGYSCLGSSAVSGKLEIDELLGRRDSQNILFEDALRQCDVEPHEMIKAHEEFKSRKIEAYLEIHIEQGPQLEQMGRSVACVYGAAGVQRHYIEFRGQSAHAGSQPIALRQDPFLAAAEAALAFRDIAKKYHAFSTVGEITVEPNVVTIVPETCRISLDQRSIDSKDLQKMVQEAKDITKIVGEKNQVSVEWRNICSVAPQLFDKSLVKRCQQAIEEEVGHATTMYSGPLHDAVEMAKLVPTVMIFTMSKRGLSHTKEEFTPDYAIEEGVRSFLRLVEKIMKE